MKILIADDETLVRSYLRNLLLDIDPTLQIEEAADGVKMLKSLLAGRHDVCFVDIRMPRMNGLEAIQAALPACAATDFYLLTGIDDFEYARKGIRLEVKDYLLKPVRRHVLEKLLLQCADSLRRKRENEYSMLRSFAAGLLDGSAEDRLALHPVRALLLVCDSVAISPPYPDALQLAHALNSLGRATAYCKITQAGLLVFVYDTSPVGEEHIALATWLKQKYTCHTILETEELTTGNFQPEYDRLQAVVAQRPLFAFAGRHAANTKPTIVPEEIQYACKLCKESIEAYISRDFVHHSLKTAELASLLQSNRENSQIASICAFMERSYDISARSPKQLAVGLRSLSAQLLQEPDEKTNVVQTVQRYLDEHYAENIGIGPLAENLGLSANYLSALFKKTTGKTIVAYLTNLRMEHSKRLLCETSDSIKDIASQVGYYSASYFIRRFAACNGTSPLEYREAHRRR